MIGGVRRRHRLCAGGFRSLGARRAALATRSPRPRRKRRAETEAGPSYFLDTRMNFRPTMPTLTMPLLNADKLAQAKSLGFSDRQIATLSA